MLADAFTDKISCGLLDNIVTDHFAEEFGKKHNVDLYKQPKSMIKVLKTSNKLKEVLYFNKRL